MGILIAPTNGYYKNARVINNLICYITRTRVFEDKRGELVDYKGFGTSQNPEKMIYQFQEVQREIETGDHDGRKAFHEIFCIEDTTDLYYSFGYFPIQEIAEMCARYYYLEGFQVVYAIHMSRNKGLHIHFGKCG